MKEYVLITGASGGIGSAIARAFALTGYGVILHYNTNEDKINALEKLFKDNGISAISIKADLEKDEDIIHLADIASQYNIKVLINNAGISHTSLFTDDSFDDITHVTETNLTSAIKLTRLLLPGMISKKSGSIINISSIWGECGAACEVVYSAAKAGLIGFTKALAKEVAPSGIRVNCITPGVIRTDMLKEHSTETLEQLAKDTPLGRLGEAADVANGAVFLASQKADYITGEILKINGGFLI